MESSEKESADKNELLKNLFPRKKPTFLTKKNLKIESLKDGSS